MTASAMPPLRAVRAWRGPFRQSFPLGLCFLDGLSPSRCSCALLQHTKQRRNTAFRRRTLDLFQSPTNSWREGLLEPAGTCSFEKTTFSRRRSRAPSRRRRFLEDGHVLLREDGIFSKKIACFFEKTAFSRRWLRASSRRSHFLEGGRVHLREDLVFSKIVECFFEKVASARRWPRPPTRRSRFPEGGHVLLRKDSVFPRMVVRWFDLRCPENGTFLIFGTLSVIRAKRKQLKIKET